MIDDDLPAALSAPPARFGCRCRRHTRRLFTGALLVGGAGLALPLRAREGVEVGARSGFSRIVSADDIEQAARQNYQELLQQAASKGQLAAPGSAQLVRLRTITQQLVAHTYEWNPRARQWRWEVNLIASPQINAFCMPGGKIAFFTGILDKLELTDDEVAMVIGHEMAAARTRA